ncbi:MULTISPECIES: twitch domain-containing radical SAM protein [Streptosporangium]|uniref:Organic radical activating enzyme n=1 Tax=Streptosporangium brasiliense TaxID=47480 RepID=A0ABT9R333_9ACTN|nr:twitch domain-containing radical SAM protein [Streptosporangium brasiliense]MDP9863643.1 organic radical activating enzyme [Streptosporangium brasiliense]
MTNGEAAAGSMCVLPWIHLCASIDGVYGRCCVDDAMYHNELYEQQDEPEFTLKEDAIGCSPRSRYARDNPDRVMGVEEAFNSPNMKRTRLAMLAGERVAACSYCYHREDRGALSYRQEINERFRDTVDFDALAARTAADGTVEDFPFFLDIRFGNTCSLRCVMCTYPVSSGWGAKKRPPWSSAVIDPYRDDEELWKTLRENAHLIRRLYFAGGEPFMQPGHFALLDLLVETGNAGNVDIVYNSNLTVLPESVFPKFRHFKSVGIGASCDGVGEVFEKIRTGADWETFVGNVRRAKTEVKLWLQVAPQRDNVWGLRDLLAFARDEGLDIDLANVVQWPADFSVTNLPEAEKAAATDELTSLVEWCAGLGWDKPAEDLRALRTFMNAADPTVLAHEGTV